MAVAFHRLEIVDVRRETPEAVSLAFAVPPELAEAYGFAPGQHLTLRAMMDSAEVRRSYSISSGLDDGELRVVVKKVEGGLFSRFINEKVEAGDEIDVMTPQGRFGDRIGIYHVLSREKQEVALLNGRIDGEKIATVLRTVVPAGLLDHVFLCGPG